jgi:hypothetical protein
MLVPIPLRSLLIPSRAHRRAAKVSGELTGPPRPPSASSNWRGVRRFSSSAALVAALAGLLAPAAEAAGTPSTATQLSFGQPHTFASSRGTTAEWEWMKLPTAMVLGDEVTLAISAEKRGRFCLIAATDDFGLTDGQRSCNRPGLVGSAPHIDVTGQVRKTIRWSADTSGVYLLANAESNAQGGRPVYSVTVESIVSTIVPPPAPVVATPAPVPAGPVAPPVSAPPPVVAPTPAKLTDNGGATFTAKSIRLRYSVDLPGTEYHAVYYRGRLVAEYGGQTKAGQFRLTVRWKSGARARMRRALRSSAATRLQWKITYTTADGAYSQATFKLKFS